MALVCRVCGKDNLNNMGVHLRKKHDMSNDDYDDFCNKLDGKPVKKKVDVDELTKLVEEQQKMIAELKANGVPSKDENAELVSNNTFDEVEDSEDVIPTVDEHPLVAEATAESASDISPNEIDRNLFNHVERKDPDRPLSEFLEKECNGMTEGELINVLREYFQIGIVPVIQKMKNYEKIGFREAQEMAKNSPPSLKTIKSEIAQALEENFGYKVYRVSSKHPRGGNPKTWYLEYVGQ